MKLSRPDFGSEVNLLLNLFEKHNWITNKDQALEELISSCKNQNEKIMLYELLEKFVYLDDKNFREKCDEIGKQILFEWNLVDSETQITGIAFNKNDLKSSHIVIYELKKYFAKNNIFDMSYSSTIGGSVKNATAKNNIVLVDDFIGTGKTVSHGIAELKKYLADASIKHVNIFVASIAAMEEGISKITNDFGVPIYTSMRLQKGLSDHYFGSELKEKIEHMERLESLLLKDIDGNILPSMGYGKSEALFSNGSCNTPNNVFPIFWWKYFSDKQTRITLLDRAGF